MNEKTQPLADLYAEEDAAAAAAYRLSQTVGTPEYVREQARLAADRARRANEPVIELPPESETEDEDEEDSEDDSEDDSEEDFTDTDEGAPADSEED